MGKVFLFGGMGAMVNCAIAIRSSALSLENLVAEMLVQPFSAMKSLSPLFLGFMLGTAVMFAWTFLRALAVRFLLGYDGWFLHPKRQINKVWYLLMMVLVGKKNWGSMNYQQMLPSLPVPSLDSTLKKYLESVRPLLTNDEYANTENAVKNFKSQGGNRLQFYLKIRSWTSRNWIADWWLKYIYLKQRTPISFNSNYFASCGPVIPTSSQLDRAAMIMHQAVKGTESLNNGKAKNMLAQNLVPFCMDGCRYVTACCRIPGKEEDSIKKYSSKHIDFYIVIRRGRLFKVKVKSQNGQPMPPALIRKQLEQIVDMTQGDEVCQDGDVCSFTGLPRAKWAELRERLIQNPTNRKIIEAIQSSISILTLADEAPPIDDLTFLARELFHGHVNDRWFDKGISNIVFKNGVVGSNVEHAPLDATVCGQYWEYILQEEQYDKDGRVAELTEDEKRIKIPSEPEQLRWDLSGFETDLKESKEHLQAMIDDSDLVVIQPSYGKRFPKQCRLSPDGWFQMALQLTYYKLHRKIVLTYESATTRLYYKGRTETIRPVSCQSKKWVEAMLDESCAVEEKKKLLKDAISCQEKRKFEAMRGMGIDRHMFGLYIISQWLKLDPLPDLFTDKAFQMPFTLSTSQTPVSFVYPYSKEKASIVGGFGTVTQDGYGVSYLINGEDKVSFVIHSKKSCPETDSSLFARTLCQTMEDMKALYTD